jgi:adenylate kinase
LVAAVPSSGLFSRSGDPAKRKLIFLGSLSSLSDNVMDEVRSLHIEHVSPARLMRPEISRRPLSGVPAEEVVLAALRRWFWTRKPDAGFFLTDFPATLLQAQVFDEWLETRCEALDAVVAAPGAAPVLVAHYRNLGLLAEAG